MALWVCEDCTTKYAVGLENCPQCHSTRHYEDGEHMPKITHQGGSSIEGNPPSPLNADPATQLDVETETEGGEEPSVGTDYSESSERQRQREESSSPDQSSPALTTESPSVLEPEESDTADSVGGDQTTQESVTKRRRRY